VKRRSGAPSAPPAPSAPHTARHSPKAIALWQHAPGFPSLPADSAAAPSAASDHSATPTDPDLLWLAAFDPHPVEPGLVTPIDSDDWMEAPVRCECQWTPAWCGEEAADEGQLQLLCGDLFGWADPPGVIAPPTFGT